MVWRLSSLVNIPTFRTGFTKLWHFWRVSGPSLPDESSFLLLLFRNTVFPKIVILLNQALCSNRPIAFWKPYKERVMTPHPFRNCHSPKTSIFNRERFALNVYFEILFLYTILTDYSIIIFSYRGFAQIPVSNFIQKFFQLLHNWKYQIITNLYLKNNF